MKQNLYQGSQTQGSQTQRSLTLAQALQEAQRQAQVYQATQQQMQAQQQQLLQQQQLQPLQPQVPSVPADNGNAFGGVVEGATQASNNDDSGLSAALLAVASGLDSYSSLKGAKAKAQYETQQELAKAIFQQQQQQQQEQQMWDLQMQERNFDAKQQWHDDEMGLNYAQLDQTKQSEENKLAQRLVQEQIAQEQASMNEQKKFYESIAASLSVKDQILFWTNPAFYAQFICDRSNFKWPFVQKDGSKAYIDKPEMNKKIEGLLADNKAEQKKKELAEQMRKTGDIRSRIR